MSKFVGTVPLSYKKGFTGPRSHEDWETLVYSIYACQYFPGILWVAISHEILWSKSAFTQMRVESCMNKDNPHTR